MKLKFLTIIFFASVLFSCKQNAPDPEKASQFIEDYINQTGKGDYSNLSSFYSEEMKYGEDDEQRIEKLKQIRDGLGDVVNVKRTEIKEESYNDEPAVSLVYAVKHNLMTVTETFTVIDENGHLKIARQNIVSVK
jgi:hypothetical protein